MLVNETARWEVSKRCKVSVDSVTPSARTQEPGASRSRRRAATVNTECQKSRPPTSILLPCDYQHNAGLAFDSYALRG